MAAPRKKAPPPTRRERATARVGKWLESRAVWAAALLTLFSLFSFFVGTTRDLVMAGWRHYTGAELALAHDPKLAKLEQLAAQVAERTNASEQRLGNAEKTLNEIRKLKEAEQERTRAVEEAQRAACLAGDLSPDACHRLGYPTTK